MVFVVLTIEFEILSNLEYNTFRVNSLVPLAFTEVESTDSNSYIKDGTFLSGTRFLLDTCELSILISREQVDTALGKLHQKVTWGHFLILKMEQLRSLVLDKLNIKRSNLDVKYNTLGMQSQNCNLVWNATERPVLVRIVHAARLQQSDRSELGGCKFNGSAWFFEFKLTTDEVSCPALGLLIPNSNLNIGGILSCEDIVRQLVDHSHTGDSTFRIILLLRVINFLKSIFNCVYCSNNPF